MKRRFAFLIAYACLLLTPWPTEASYTKTAMNDCFAQACHVLAEAIEAAVVMLWRWCTVL